MKVTFLIPPQLDGKLPAERTAGCTRVTYQAPNIYELTVAALVRSIDNVEVVYRDFIAAPTGKKEFEEFILTDDSDVYSLWTVNLSIENDLEAISVIRKFRKNIPVIMMGPGPTYFTSRCLPDGKVYVVRGEPELTVKELVVALRDGSDVSGLKGISLIVGGKIKNNPPRELIKDLDSLPFAARDLVASIKFHNPKLKKSPYTTMVTSRNCPYKCIYCVPSSLTFAREIEYRAVKGIKPPISFRSTESIEKEVAHLASLGYKAIGMMDDNFIWNEKRTAEICRIMKKYGMVWGCQARVDAITESVADSLAQGGCKYVDLGVESFDDGILEYIHKGITSADIYKAIELLHKYHVPVKLNVLIGSSPLETADTVRHTLREVKRLKVDQVMVNIVSPFPGTEFHRLAVENGWLKYGEYIPTDVQRHSSLDLPYLSGKEMEKLLFRSNLNYFLSPRFVMRQIGRFTSIEEFRSALKALKRKLFG